MKRRKFTPEVIGAMRALRESGLSLREIAIQFKSHSSCIHNLLNPEKQAARVLTKKAIRNGELVRAANCEKCGTPAKTDAHHPDYSKPLEVQWLCYACHCMAHGKQIIHGRKEKGN